MTEPTDDRFDATHREPPQAVKNDIWRLETACCGTQNWVKRRFTSHGNSRQVRYECMNEHCERYGDVTALRDKKDGRHYDPTGGHEL